MANPRQPIDSDREDMSKNRFDDTTKREASPLELEDDDMDASNDLSDEDDLDY